MLNILTDTFSASAEANSDTNNSAASSTSLGLIDSPADWISLISSNFFVDCTLLQSIIHSIWNQIKIFESSQSGLDSAAYPSFQAFLRFQRVFLFSGPSGSGKSEIARAIANNSGINNCCVLNYSEVLSAEIGKSEKIVSSTFDAVKRRGPGFLIIEEFQTSKRRSDEERDDADGDGDSLDSRIFSSLRSQIFSLHRDRIPVSSNSAAASLSHFSPRDSLLFPPLFLFIISRDPSPWLSLSDFHFPLDALAPAERANLLARLTRRWPIADRQNTIEKVAARLHGFVGSDLISLTREVAFKSIRHRTDSVEIPTISFDDFLSSIAVCRPANIADLSFRPPIPPMKLLKLFPDTCSLIPTSSLFPSIPADFLSYFADLAGFDGLIEEIYYSALQAIYSPTEFQLQFPSGILLHGPSGTGKSALALAIARSTRFNLLCVNGNSLVQSLVGESEKSVQKLFEKARNAAPTVILIDQIESLAALRISQSNQAHQHSGSVDDPVSDRLLSSLLVEIDGGQQKNRYFEESAASNFSSRVLLIATTNEAAALDPAILRPGRLDFHYRIELPNFIDRFKILIKTTAAMPIHVEYRHANLIKLVQIPELPDSDSRDLLHSLSAASDDFRRQFLFFLASRSVGLSSAELISLCRESGLIEIRRDRAAVKISADAMLEAFRINISVDADGNQLINAMQPSTNQFRSFNLSEHENLLRLTKEFHQNVKLTD